MVIDGLKWLKENVMNRQKILTICRKALLCPTLLFTVAESPSCKKEGEQETNVSDDIVDKAMILVL